MAPSVQRPQRPTPATLQEKYFIEAVDMLWAMMSELQGIREELKAIRTLSEKPVTVINNAAAKPDQANSTKRLRS
jgi:hypothetical protein